MRALPLLCFFWFPVIIDLNLSVKMLKGITKNPRGSPSQGPTSNKLVLAMVAILLTITILWDWILCVCWLRIKNPWVKGTNRITSSTFWSYVYSVLNLDYFARSGNLKVDKILQVQDSSSVEESWIWHISSVENKTKRDEKDRIGNGKTILVLRSVDVTTQDSADDSKISCARTTVQRTKYG